MWDEIDNNAKCHYLSLFLTVIIIIFSSAVNIKYISPAICSLLLVLLL